MANNDIKWGEFVLGVLATGTAVGIIFTGGRRPPNLDAVLDNMPQGIIPPACETYLDQRDNPNPDNPPRGTFDPLKTAELNCKAALGIRDY